MNSSFTSKINLSNKDIFYNELQVKYLKTIYKSLLGEELSPEIIFLNINNILEKITSLDKKDVFNLNILDYFLLLFEIRCTSIGNLIFIEPQDRPNTKIEININKFIDILTSFKQQLVTIDTFKNIQIFYKIPSVNDLLYIESGLNIDNLFIKKIIINNTIIDFSDISQIDKENVIEQLPVKIASIIFKKISSILNDFNNLNLLSTTFGLENKLLIFNCDVFNLAGIIKILFGEQLMTLYENILILCKTGNFTPEYIETCTPGEYILFVKKLNALINQQNNDKSTFNENFNPINNDLL